MTAASYVFDQESFEDISDQAKDFISFLLKKDQRLAWFSFFLFFYLMIMADSKSNHHLFVIQVEGFKLGTYEKWLQE